jgi:tRNA uridine 5-carboxymethylaminomethyl modification enzyme
MRDGRRIAAHAVILATGTYLNGLLHISDRAWQSGPSGLAPSMLLAENLRKHGLRLRRFKTGTPARAKASTLDYGKMQEQKGDEKISPFSYMNDAVGENKISCWLTYTNERSHQIVADNIEKTAPYGGYTTGVGPRYCLSIEDKVSRFPERKRHQLFLEPEGISVEDVYIQGMSTSLPEDIQEQFYRSIDGLEHAEFSKYAYSIEYDCLDPLTLWSSLEHREIQCLYCAGQFNGSSGYEEAAAQGIIAGINAARALDGKPPWVPNRSEAYIGVLIDDLVTKGTEEPYRIMTSRAEFRLVLRQDNADLRLTEKGHEIGLASEERLRRCQKKKSETETEIQRLSSTWISGTKLVPWLSAWGQADAADFEGRMSLADLLKRPGIGYNEIAVLDDGIQGLSDEAKQQAVIQIKYQGYIEKQMKQIERFKKLEGKKLPPEIDYEAVRGMRIEAIQKLKEVRPVSIGQASRISGVSPADINVLLVHLLKLEGGKSTDTTLS